ncbi:MAG: FAD-binding protein [Coriobacteriales bacterium]|nr:FAD-binding protein [Coriobacteriales bacterium]
MEITRKQLLHGVAAASACAMAAGTVSAFADDATQIAWDAEYDVVVAGYGASGAVAVIEAADNGASVLLVDKAPEGREGGCSKANQSLITCTDNPDDFYTYMDALRGGFSYPTDSMLRMYCEEAAKNWDYLDYLGAPEADLNFHARGADLEDLPCADSVYVTTLSPSYYLFLQECVEERSNIEVWSESPIIDCIQDPISKVILGAVIEHEGKRLNIKAKGGVILGTGGFEANLQMVESFFGETRVGYTVSGYNTGDGVLISMKYGANLVNMTHGNAFGWCIFNEETGAATSLGRSVRNGGIFVAGDGVRFYNVSARARRGNQNFFGNHRPAILPKVTYLVFDDATRAMGPVVAGYSEDGAAEIEAGLIIKGETIEELAEKLGMVPETLAETVAAFNQGIIDGNDPMGRSTSKCNPIEVPPFYAISLDRSITNTEGGALRNEASLAVNTFGEVIENLYVVGCMGCPTVGKDWNCGGNMSESIVFGRIAGAKAAAAARGEDPANVKPIEVPANTYTIPTREEVAAAKA